jgi:aminoglycoside 2''-phosphotransferase
MSPYRLSLWNISNMNADDCARSIEAIYPGFHIRSYTPIASGWDSFVLLVDDAWIFRFARRPDVAAQFQRETRLLPELARCLPVAVPRFALFGVGDAGLPFVGYRKLDGIPLTPAALTPSTSSALARQLAAFLTALHGFSPARAADIGLTTYTPGTWRREYAEFYTWIRTHAFPLLTPTARGHVAASWGSFLDDGANFRFQPTLIHHDLAPEHILLDPVSGSLAGVIDWGDAVVGDPAMDVVGLFHDFGPDFTARVLDAYQGVVDDTFQRRAAFYTCIVPLHAIRFGFETNNQEYLNRGLERVERMQWAD